MQLDTQWTGLPPIQSSRYESTDDFWRRIYHKQSRSTMVLYGTLRKYKGMRQRLTLHNAAKDEQLPAYLSWCLLMSMLYSDKLFPDHQNEIWDEKLVEWLNYAYEVILLRMRLEPESSICEITRALLNNQLREDFKPAMLSEGGEIRFAEASKFKLQSAQGRPKAVIDKPSPFPYEQALKEGLKKIFWASRIAYKMRKEVEYKGFYLGDKKTAIIDIIQAIHQNNSETLDSAEKLMAFDFQAYVIDFLLTKRAWLSQQ